ncbi:SMP-30/gluconolactonase/LRE family protein [Nocardia sp. NPDC056100]|uniref:SMP-30/gluconolactonase/LRE family protein n=1 Tax=Nocardia sp. NPDC056100 TaxID=3345712 RepID=UPI0035DE58E4
MPDTRQHNLHARNPSRYRALASSCAAVVALTATGAATSANAHADPASCPVATATTFTAPTVPFLDWAENLGYDAQGNLWVSRLYRNEVQRYDTTGRITATVPVTSPGAIRLGPDHLLYVVYGDNSLNMVPGARNGGVVRFDPAAPTLTPEVFIGGLTMPNGAAFDPAGNLYIADTAEGVIRVRRDGTVDTDWTAQATLFGVNGLAIQGDSLYTTVYLAPDGRIQQIPIATPARSHTTLDLPLADDLTSAPDGFLYVATTSGTLLRVDPTRRTTCALLSTGPLAAVVPIPDTPDLMVTTGSGDILRVHPSD